VIRNWKKTHKGVGAPAKQRMEMLVRQIGREGKYSRKHQRGCIKEGIPGSKYRIPHIRGADGENAKRSLSAL